MGRVLSHNITSVIIRHCVLNSLLLSQLELYNFCVLRMSAMHAFFPDVSVLSNIKPSKTVIDYLLRTPDMKIQRVCALVNEKTYWNNDHNTTWIIITHLPKRLTLLSTIITWVSYLAKWKVWYYIKTKSGLMVGKSTCVFVYFSTTKKKKIT